MCTFRRHDDGKCTRAVSPHLDDAVFSAGGTLARLADAGHDVAVVTCFTASVADPSPFALSTQLDKGLSADVDYMALRRAEDQEAMAALGVPLGHHLPLPEAPHRGYTSAADLFAGRHDDDTVADALAEALAPWLRDADLVLAPQAIGDHVDHQIVATVVARLVAPERIAWWRDAPYALRHPDAPPAPEVTGAERTVDVGSVMDRKIEASCCYRTQIGFQFGGSDGVGSDLRSLGRDEARRVGVDGIVERLRAPGALPVG